MREPAPSSPRALPVLIAVAGQVATGKSSVARMLAERIGAVYFEADRVHDELLAGTADEIERLKGFTPAFEARVYAELRRRATAALAAGQRVVLDACFPLNIQRFEARSLARRSGAAFLFVECEAAKSDVRERLAARNAESPTTGWTAIHDRLEERWEDVAALAADETLRVRCQGKVEEAVARVLSAPCLRERRVEGIRPMALPKAVTFDCWNTLVYEADWEAAHGKRVDELQTAAREAGHTVERSIAKRAFETAWKRHMDLWLEGVESGAHEVALWGLVELGVPAPEPAAFAHLIQLFEEMSHTSKVFALDGAARTLSALTSAGVSCALICDTGLTPGRVVRAHLDHHGLLRHLKAQIFSDEAGVPKPDPRMFRGALDALGVEPEQAVHVGDLRRTDIVGARALGMRAVRIRDRHDDTSDLPEADHVVGSHADLLSLLGLA